MKHSAVTAYVRLAAISFTGLAIASGEARAADERTDQLPGNSREQIIVTGSRITLPDLQIAEPVVSLDNAYIAERNASHFADALNEIPGIRGSLTPDGAQSNYGQGVNFANAYGLGSNRTLTLINGKRAVSSNGPTVFAGAGPGTQFDLNAIPSILVERVDRLAIGGAPVYGSDAIAGTLNVVLKRRLTGLETRALSGITERGDNFRWQVAAAGGADFAEGRGNITAAVSYDRAGGVGSTSRGAYRANLGSAPNPCTVFQPGLCTPFGSLALLGPPGRTPANDGRINPEIGFNDSASDGNPATVLVRNFSLAALSPGGVISSGPSAYSLRFAPDGSLVPYRQGTLFGAPLSGFFAPAALASGGDGLKLFDYIGLTSKVRRFNAALSFTYDMSDTLTVFADGLFYEGRTSEPVDLPTFNAVLFQGISGPLTFRTDSPFLTGQAREQLAAAGYGETFQLSRANTDLPDTSGASRNRVYRLVAGLRGQLALAGRDYDFEVSGNFGRSDFADFGQDLDRQKFINAVNVTSLNGRPACSATPTVSTFPPTLFPVADPACQPLNLFGTGSATPEALAYVLQDTLARSRLEQRVFNANIGGSPFDLFGNPVAINVGYEHREEQAAFRPDAFTRDGLGRNSAVTPVSGSYNLDELFGEVFLPIIGPANDSLFSALSVFARGRYVDSSVNGGFASWSAGGTFAPIKDIALRGNFTRSFRSPAILELFSPRIGVNLGVPDLCSAASIAAGPVPAIRTANCNAFLAQFPNATPLLAATATVPGLTGGNPELRSERADSYTFGVIVRPRFVPGLSITADYLDIRIDRPIARLSVNDIAQGCFDNPDFDATNPALGNSFCKLIGRDGMGQVVSDVQNPAVVSGFVNGKRIDFSGVQVALAWKTDLEKLGIDGALDIGADVFHLRRRVVDITGVAPDRSDGLVGDPNWQGQFRVRYANSRWGMRTHVHYTGRQIIARDNRGPSPNDTREFDHFDAFATVDTSLFINAGDDVRFTFSVTNLFDRVGQDYFGFVVPLSINDAIGRRFAVSLSKDW